MAANEEQIEAAEVTDIAFVVEDVAEDQASLEAILGDAGYVPLCTDDSGSALDLARESGPRLIVLSADVNRGFNLCHRMKKDDLLSGVPVILLSAKAPPDVLRKHRMLPTRADAYLEKPFEAETFLQILSELLPGEPPVDDLPDEPPEDLPVEALTEVEALTDGDIIDVGEVEVGEIPDRTLVSGGLETAVVTYVEEEMDNLKEVVTRLESEKGGLNDKVRSLETQLNDERKRIDSGLEILLEKKQQLKDEAEDASEQPPLDEGTSEKLREAEAEIDLLHAKLESLEEKAVSATDSDKALRAELTQTTILFERLEAGYKESLVTAESRRESAEQNAVQAEQDAEELREKVQKIESSIEELPALREMAARAEMLEEECQKAKDELESIRTESDELKQEASRVKDLEQATRDVEEAKAELEARIDEMTRANEELTAINEDLLAENNKLKEQFDVENSRMEVLEESRLSAEQTAEFARAEVSEMRDRFNKLKSIIGESLESPSGLVENPGSIVEDSIELVDESE